MKKLTFVIASLISSFVYAQNETIVVEESANLIFDGDIKLVLDDISLTNEGTLDLTEGEIVISSSTSSFLSTNQSLYLNSLITQNSSLVFGLEGAFEAFNLEVASTDNLVVSDTSSLTLPSSATVDATGEITVESGAAFWINKDISGTATLDNVTVERIGPHNSSVGKYSVYGSPVQNSPFSVFGSNAQSWIYQHDENTNDFSVPSESNMTRSKGYFVAFPGDSEGKVSFNGTPFYQNRNFSASRTEVGNNDQEGFNLVANLFTCPLDFETFIEAQTVLEESTIWLWDDFSSDAGGGTSADYLAINYLGSSTYNITDSRNEGEQYWDGTINVAQGFFVKVNNGGGNVSFRESMKTLEGNDDASFFRSESIPKYWLSIGENNTSRTNSTLIGFSTDATYEKDYLYDATKFGAGFSIYSLIDDYKLAIQGLPYEWLTNLEDRHLIRLGYNVEEQGSYTLSLDHLEDNSLDALYLNDHLNLESINILSESYEFSTQAGVINDRFSISLEPLRPENILANENLKQNILVYGNPNAIILDAGFDGHFKISTLSGKLVYEKELKAGRTEIPSESGIYIVTVESAAGLSSYKVKVTN